jgi:hypothetical protein
MEYIAETSLANFPFWSGAKDRAAMLTWDQLSRIESELESIWFDKTPTDSEINDLFWFEFEYVCGLIGLIYASDGNIICIISGNFVLCDISAVSHCEYFFGLAYYISYVVKLMDCLFNNLTARLRLNLPPGSTGN